MFIDILKPKSFILFTYCRRCRMRFQSKFIKMLWHCTAVRPPCWYQLLFVLKLKSFLSVPLVISCSHFLWNKIFFYLTIEKLSKLHSSIGSTLFNCWEICALRSLLDNLLSKGCSHLMCSNMYENRKNTDSIVTYCLLRLVLAYVECFRFRHILILTSRNNM